jgi:hypothetical protein
MQVTITRAQALFAVTMLSCLVAVSVALAGPSESGGPQAAASASVKRQIKKLKTRVRALERGAPPKGPASGDLTGNYPNPLIAANAVTGANVADEALTPADIADVDFLRTGTARLTDAPGGGSSGKVLFTIGRVELSAFCTNGGGGSMTAGVSPVLQSTDTGPIRPVMVTDGQGTLADVDVPLVPFDVQFFTILTSTSVAAQEASFAILDSQDTSASGVVAASVDPANSSCVLTAHAVG